MPGDNDSVTETSSRSEPSTASTVTTDSSASPLIPDAPLTPPRVVHVEPEPAPYAQLCRQQSRLITMIVGSPPASKYTSIEDSPGVLSSFSSSTDSSNSSQDEDAFSLGCWDPQDIVWMDPHWLGESLDDDDSWLLGNNNASSPKAKVSCTTDGVGCGQFLPTIRLPKLKQRGQGTKATTTSRESAKSFAKYTPLY
jgi:hypothetical protein